MLEPLQLTTSKYASLRYLSSVPRRPRAGIVAILLLSTLGMVLVALVTGNPVPRFHDEFAYLLTADTFVEGRLSNPTHPFWRHFETFHVLFEPSYQAKYPPAQGLFLAAGMLLGHPVLGVWLSVLLMLAATAWALRALLQPQWAFFATLLLALELGVASYWAQSYWGGAVAASGGALLFGATARIVRGEATWRSGLAGGVGLAILANSRPLEGLVLSCALAVWVTVAWIRERELVRRGLSSAIPLLIVGMGGVGLTGIYNEAVTGRAMTFPYALYESKHALGSPLVLHSPNREGEAQFVHPELERFQRTWGLERQQALRDEGLLGIVRRAPELLRTLLGPAAVLLFFIPWVWRYPGIKGAVLASAAVMIPVLLTLGAYPHYMAPAVAPAYLVVGTVARRLHARKGRPLGDPLLVAVLLLTLVDMGKHVTLGVERSDDWAAERQAMLADLRNQERGDLVFVHYPEDYFVHYDWVYNRAAIDAADVVWARPIDHAADSSLIAYFGNRRVWDLVIDRASEPIILAERDTNSAPGK